MSASGSQSACKMDELRRAIAESNGQDPETWPEHGNAGLAIAASYELKKIEIRAQAERIRALEDALRPFAEFHEVAEGELYGADARDSECVHEFSGGDNNSYAAITVGYLRDAARVLSNGAAPAMRANV